MKIVVRVVVLALVALALPQCTGSGMMGCPQIAQKSEGACRIGTGPSSYKDDAWRQQ